jgi:hypothetical protein
MPDDATRDGPRYHGNGRYQHPRIREYLPTRTSHLMNEARVTDAEDLGVQSQASGPAKRVCMTVHLFQMPDENLAAGLLR